MYSLDTGSRWQDKLRPEITLEIINVTKLNNQNAVFFRQLSPRKDKNSLLTEHGGTFYSEEQFKDCFERVPSKKAKTSKAKTPAKGSEAAEVEAEAALTKKYVKAFWGLAEDKREEILNAWMSLPKDTRGEDPRGKDYIGKQPLRAARCSPRGTPGPGKPPLRAARCSPRGPPGPGKPPLRAARCSPRGPPGKPALMAARCSPRGPPGKPAPSGKPQYLSEQANALKRKQPESSTEEPKPPKPPKITKLEKGINCVEADDGTLFLKSVATPAAAEKDNTAETKNQSTGDLNPDDMVMVIVAVERAKLSEVPLPYFCQWKNIYENEKQLIRHVMAKKSSFKGYRDHDIFPLNTNDERTDVIWDAAETFEEKIPNERWTQKLPDTPIKYRFTIVQE